jgi:hypothetical protein
MFAPPHVLAKVLPPSLVSLGRRPYIPIVWIRYPPDEPFAASDVFELSGFAPGVPFARRRFFCLWAHRDAREPVDSAYSTAAASWHQHADRQSYSVPNLPYGLLAILHTISNVCRAEHPEFDFPISRTSFRGNSWLETLHRHVGIGVEPDPFDVQLCPSVCRAYRGAAGSTFPNKHRIPNSHCKHASQQAYAASVVWDEDFQIVKWTKEQRWYALLSLMEQCIASQVAIFGFYCLLTNSTP